LQFPRSATGGRCREQGVRRRAGSGLAPLARAGGGRGGRRPTLVGGLGAGGWKGVVLEGLLEDRRVDQAEDVLGGAQAGCLDPRLDPAAGGDDAGGLWSFWLNRGRRGSAAGARRARRGRPRNRSGRAAYQAGLRRGCGCDRVRRRTLAGSPVRLAALREVTASGEPQLRRLPGLRDGPAGRTASSARATTSRRPTCRLHKPPNVSGGASAASRLRQVLGLLRREPRRNRALSALFGVSTTAVTSLSPYQVVHSGTSLSPSWGRHRGADSTTV
jgi:hypothetical protein